MSNCHTTKSNFPWKFQNWGEMKTYKLCQLSLYWRTCDLGRMIFWFHFTISFVVYQFEKRSKEFSVEWVSWEHRRSPTFEYWSESESTQTRTFQSSSWQFICSSNSTFHSFCHPHLEIIKKESIHFVPGFRNSHLILSNFIAICALCRLLVIFSREFKWNSFSH